MSAPVRKSVPGLELPQSQVFPKYKTVSRYLSTPFGSVPISPHVTRYSGFSAISATLHDSCEQIRPRVKTRGCEHIPLGRQCLPCTGATVQQNDQSITLAGNDIIHLSCGFLHIDQCKNHLLHSFIENQTSKGLRVPFDTVKIINNQVC